MDTDCSESILQQSYDLKKLQTQQSSHTYNSINVS